MEKKDQLIAVAFELFYRYGVHATGINQVISESGIAKKTLYNYFSSKEDLIAATVDYRDRQFFNWLNIRISESSDGRESLYAMFDALDDWFNERDEQVYPFHGCYFINVSAEFSNVNHPIHKQCATHKKKILKLIMKHTAQVFSNETIEVEISEMIAMLKEGAIVQAHVMGDLQSAAKAKAIVEGLIESKLKTIA